MAKIIHLSKKESEKIIKNMKRSGIKTPKQIKSIVFDKSFERGPHIALCLNCGYPAYFYGRWLGYCSCCSSPKFKIYPVAQMIEVIRKSQDIILKNWEKKE